MNTKMCELELAVTLVINVDREDSADVLNKANISKYLSDIDWEEKTDIQSDILNECIEINYITDEVTFSREYNIKVSYEANETIGENFDTVIALIMQQLKFYTNYDEFYVDSKTTKVWWC